MNENIKVEITISSDVGNMQNILKEIRVKLIEIGAIKGVINVTTWQFNKDRGLWLSYGWGTGKGSTQIWVPLNQK